VAVAELCVTIRPIWCIPHPTDPVTLTEHKSWAPAPFWLTKLKIWFNRRNWNLNTMATRLFNTPTSNTSVPCSKRLKLLPFWYCLLQPLDPRPTWIHIETKPQHQS
jgi:hypothetical protein